MAPTPIHRSGRIVFASVKDRAQISNVKNCLFSVRCKDCDFKIWLKTKNLVVERTLRGKLANDSMINEHMKNNPRHKIPFSIYEKKIYKNMQDLNIAYELVSRRHRK